MTERLTDERLARFAEDGFLAIDRLVGDDTVAQLREAYDEILSGRVVVPGDRTLGRVTRQVMVPSNAHPVFRSNGAIDAAREIARELLDDDPVFGFDMLIHKPPGHPHETPWHQDVSYTDMPFATAGTSIPPGHLQFWVALDDVDEENGCMHFLPGYHVGDVLEHRVASGDPEDESRLLALAEPERQVDLDRSVAVPLAAGGATVHGYGTPHYTPPNRSASRPRRAYIFNFSPPTVTSRIGSGRRGS